MTINKNEKKFPILFLNKNLWGLTKIRIVQNIAHAHHNENQKITKYCTQLQNIAPLYHSSENIYFRIRKFVVSKH